MTIILKSYNSQKDLKRAKRRFARRIFYVVAVISFFAASAYFLFFSNFFVIKNVAVNGNYFIASAILIKKFQEQSAGNLIFFDLMLGREQLLKEFPRLDDVQIRKKYPNKLVIDVKEKEIEEILCHDEQGKEQCFFIDKNGIMFERASGIEGFLIMKILDLRKIYFKIGDKVLNQEFLGFVQKLKQNFPRLFDFNINALELEHPSQKEVTVRIDNWRAIFDVFGDAEKQLFVLKQVLEKEIKEDINKLDYIDLRVEGRAYYKLK